MKKFVSVGDSHSYATFKGVNLEGYELSYKHMGPVTMHRIGRDGLSEEDYKEYKSGDVIMYCFGEIDIRCHIHNQIKENGRTEEEVMKELSENYVTAINKLKVPEGVQKTILIPIPPCDKSKFVFTDTNYPIIGTNEERLKYNQVLKSQLIKSGIPYLDLTRSYADVKTGMLNHSLSDGNVHIGDTSYVSLHLKEMEIFNHI